MIAAFGEPTGQGWPQIGELLIALALSAAIGLEREMRQKSAGLRTHTLVGFASALIMLVSKYGFTDVLADHVVGRWPSPRVGCRSGRGSARARGLTRVRGARWRVLRPVG